jgi:hypothetical protein
MSTKDVEQRVQSVKDNEDVTVAKLFQILDLKVKNQKTNSLWLLTK